MSVIILLIIFSIIVATGFLIAFIWAVKTGQFDDTSSPSVRILFDDQKPGRTMNRDMGAETKAEAEAEVKVEDKAKDEDDDGKHRNIFQ